MCTRHISRGVWSCMSFLIMWCGPFQGAFSLPGIRIYPAKGRIESLGHQLQAVMEGCKCYLNYRDSWRLTEVRNICRDRFLSKPSLNRRHRGFACSIAFGERSLYTVRVWMLLKHERVLGLFFLCSVVTTLASLVCDAWTLLQVSDVRPVLQDTQDKPCKG